MARRGKRGGKKKNWVADAFGANKGALHRETGTPIGQDIPVAKIESAEDSPDKKKAARARLALMARGFHHKAKGA